MRNVESVGKVAFHEFTLNKINWLRVEKVRNRAFSTDSLGRLEIKSKLTSHNKSNILRSNTEMIRKRDDDNIIFLLGAGASDDAGMPMVAQLTKELRKRLPDLPDVNGVCHPEYGQLYDLIEAQDPLVAQNYERFFEWVRLILDVRREPFRQLIETKLEPSLIEAMGHLPFVIRKEFAQLLNSYETKPDYLGRLGDFLPPQGRLKVFSLNYDCCLENACHTARIDITTGFDPDTKKWDPLQFRKTTKGINLYKLHGSLRWFGTRDTSLPIEQFQHNLVLMELRSQDLRHFRHLEISEEPELILGPGTKTQPDDPFITLACEFSSSIRQANICVVIGYSFQDDHINVILDKAVDIGLIILDINHGQGNSRYLADPGYRYLARRAGDALRNGDIGLELKKLKCLEREF